MTDDITAKQTYLRTNITKDKYQDFAEYCENIVGNMDIETWTIDYVKDLVDKFNQNQAEKEQNKKKNKLSFNAYQTGVIGDIMSLSQQIKEQQQSSSNPHNNSKSNGNVQTSKTDKPQKPKNYETVKYKEEKSAMQVLDSIFQKHNTTNEYQTKKYDKSFFQSSSFWGLPGQEQSSKGGSPNKNKQSPPNPAKFTSNNINIVEPQKFDKIFQTGIQNQQGKQAQHEKKKQSTAAVTQSNQSKKQIKFEQIAMQDQPPSVIRFKQITKQSQKKAPIKLISVKSIKAPKIPYDGQILIKQPFKQSVACFKSFERQALSHKNMKITIQKHQIVNRSFFSSDYVMYHLKVMPASIVCKRNFQDFQKLKKNLQSVYPGMRLPYLEKPGWLVSQTNDQNIKKQKKYLQYFLQDLMSHDQLRNSRILQDFLTLKDHKQMKRKFEQYQKIKKITMIEQLCLLSGEVKIQITEQNRQYNEYISGLISKINNYWLTKQKLLTEIDQMHIAITNSYKMLSDLIEEAQKDVKEFNKKVHFNQIQCLTEAFDGLLKYSHQNVSINKKQSEFLQNILLPFVRYEKENMNLMNGIIEARNNLTKQYLRRKDSQKASDNIEYLSQRLKDYKYDILQESKHITVLKYQCGYINCLTANECHHYYQKLSNKITELLGNICYAKLTQISNTINTYTELIQS